MNLKELAAILILCLTAVFTVYAGLHFRGAVNINTAGEEELLLLPMMNESKAASLVEYRSENGPFETAEDIIRVDGIGRGTLTALSPFVTVRGPHTFSVAGTEAVHDTGIRCGAELLENEEFYRKLSSRIISAEKEIRLGAYLFLMRKRKTNRANLLAHELAGAAKRGVDVYIYLERDDDDDGDMLDLNLETGKFLAEAGAKVFVDSRDRRTHFKAALIDGRHLFLGSHNMTESALKYNNELSLYIDSKDLAEDFLDYLETVDYETLRHESP